MCQYANVPINAFKNRQTKIKLLFKVYTTFQYYFRIHNSK